MQLYNSYMHNRTEVYLSYWNSIMAYFSFTNITAYSDNRGNFLKNV